MQIFGGVGRDSSIHTAEDCSCYCLEEDMEIV
jgi:hypothetical protein